MTTGSDSDFELGIDAFQYAPALSTAGSWGKARYTQRIGKHYSLRFKMKNNAEDLDNAIEQLQEALDAYTQHNPYTRAPIAAFAGSLYHTRFCIKQQESNLQAAIECFKQAFQYSPRTTRHYMETALELITVYREKGGLKK